ncbi:MAG TPA: ParB/RepB/Spo0J family partition protein [Longimicrobiaceae bacterium]|nr:ParB/RepB/Spo0J family partition protein [Longimicrobiaceae bacterium]
MAGKESLTPGAAVQPASAEAKGKKGRLGKGLGALFGEYLPDEGSAGADGIRLVSVGRITPNPFQPRRDFAPDQLAELENSIRENGLLQPLVVRPAMVDAPEGAEWELVAGERRWRAVRRLGWTEVPVVVKQIDDRAMLVLAIVENVQRADLSPLEEAAGYRRLIEEFGLTQREVADVVGRERSTVANVLRLLQLPASVQRLVGEGKLSMGHARALLGVTDERRMADFAREVAEKGLSVRAVEERVREWRSPPPSPAPAAAPDASGPHLRHLETELQRALGTAARIVVTRGSSGRIEIPFYNTEDFDRVMELLLGAEAI